MASKPHATPLLPATIGLRPSLPQPDLTSDQFLTFDELYHAIPPQGITITDFSARFKERMFGEQKFKELMHLVRAVAHLDLMKLELTQKPRPTNQEVRAAIPPEGIQFGDFVSLFNWMELPMDTQERVDKVLSQIAVPDVKTLTIRLKGPLTEEEVVAAIPDEGITLPELFAKFEARTSTDEEYRIFKVIMGDVASWDEQTERIVLRDANRVVR